MKTKYVLEYVQYNEVESIDSCLRLNADYMDPFNSLDLNKDLKYV